MAAAKQKISKPGLTVNALDYKYEVRDDRSILWTHTPPELEAVKSVENRGLKFWRPIWCGGYETDEQGKRHYHHLDCIPCHCPPGPHMLAYWANTFEVALIGGRGSGKSEDTFPFLIKGNVYSPIYSYPKYADGYYPSPVDTSYLNCPDYRFLVLRKNAKDLRDYFERAKSFFGMFGGEPTESPMGVRFPKSGAWGIFDHLADSDAWEKYQGASFTRIVIEEVNQILDEQLYMKVAMSCRTSHPCLVSQIMLTANPGGPGAKWFNARFIDISGKEGRKADSGKPMLEAQTSRTRMYIKSTVEDNPYHMAQGYDKTLDMLKRTNPTLYARWRHGDMTAMDGAYFEHFREDRREGDPPEACHVVKCTKERPAPVALDSYWPRAIGLDWGYSHRSVALWGCWHPKGQLHVYQELAVSRMGTVELGAEIAKRSYNDLVRMEVPHLSMYVSHDAFAHTDDGNSEAELIAQGINMVLGNEAAFVYAPNLDEEGLEREEAWSRIARRAREMARKTHITLISAGQNRPADWQILRELMRWWRIEQPELEFNEERARKILMTEGALAYHEYKQQAEKNQTEVLPKLLIWSCCKEVIKGIQQAVEDETNPEKPQKQDGDDALDSLCHLAKNFTFSEGKKPKDVFVRERLDRVKLINPGASTAALVMAARFAEHDYEKQAHGGRGLVIPRIAGPSRRRATVN